MTSICPPVAPDYDIQYFPEGTASITVPRVAECDAATLGRIGEDIAVQLLADHGWIAVARNVRNKYGEIDILARPHSASQSIRCIEVKTRRGETAEFTVSPKKIRNLRRCFIHWAQQQRLHWEDCLCDVITIEFDDQGCGEIQYFGGVDLDGVCAS